MNRSHLAVWAVCLASYFTIVGTGFAQVTNPFTAPSGALDTLSGASVGPSPQLNPLQGPQPGAPQPGAPQPGAPQPGAPQSGAPYYDPNDPAGLNYNYGAPGAPGQPVGPATPTPTPIPTKKVLTGERVTDAVSGTLLSDYRYVDVPESEIEGKYFNDGTHGDQVADDMVWTNVTERRDVMGAETNQIMVRLLVALERSEDISLLDFFNLNVLTTETISEIGKWRDKDAERDEKLLAWCDRFLREYHTKPDDIASPFYPLYVVPPPPLPSVKLATPVPSWRPPTSHLKAAKPGQPAPQTGGSIWDNANYGAFQGTKEKLVGH